MRRVLIFVAGFVGAALAAHGQGPYNAVKVSQLPACTLAKQGRLQTISDANPDCATGSGVAGSNYAICVCDPLLGWQTFEHGDGYIEGAAVGGGLVEVGTTLGLLTSCANGEVLKWTATGPSWGCAAAGGGPTNYAASASPAGPATSALAVTGFTASKCARFDASGNLVAASGDCSAGDTDAQTSISGNAATASALFSNPSDCSANQYATTIAANGDLTCAQVAYSQISGTPSAGIGGTLGSTADAITTASGTGGATLQASTVKVVSGNLVLPASGQLAGSDNYVRIRCVAGDNTCGWNLGPAGGDPLTARFTDSSGQNGAASIKMSLPGTEALPTYSFSPNSSTGAYWGGAGIYRISAAGVNALEVNTDRVKAFKGFQSAPLASPPYACDAAAEGSWYYDTTDHDFCDCKGVSPAWTTRGAGACS